MRINRQNTQQYLKDFDFENLFMEELGWDNHNQTLDVQIGEFDYQLTAIKKKHGMVAFECQTADGGIPNYATRRKIQGRVAQSVYENIIIFTDAERTTQIWQVARREHGRPIACPEHQYHITQSGESLIQKLEAIAFSFEEEGQLTLFGVASRVQQSFYVERVTKRFYDHFKREHAAFLEFLEGIPDQEMNRWYASIMLNRLMFIYFIQKKGFLNNDTDYLSTKLEQSIEQGDNQYYKKFLCPLFFEGFAKQKNDRSADVRRLLGDVPYLNGGIFQKHELEEHNGEAIEIQDTAFKKLFTFFKQYQWHLDDRHLLQNDNEINPEVLGYIFEKYINQKQMGAYYTKEDITDYISKNTIIPFLFDKVKKTCKTAFKGDAAICKLLQADPDRYIYPSVKKGVDLELPSNIAAGIDDVSQRTEWNTLAPSGEDEYALPTEIWRETVTRRQRYKDIRSKLEEGEIDNIDDIITYNLDIRQLAQNVIENCETPELLHAFWKAITEMTILDPTCGSGAFLFAALNILEPLYSALLDRMQAFVDDVSDIDSTEIDYFRRELIRVNEHPNRKYFILKSIIINNLYGVDIMDEAIEICKLRLFLKMVAQIEDVNQIEPLPDIDFNVKAGNTLVGYTTYNELKKDVPTTLFNDMGPRVKEAADEIKSMLRSFRETQTELESEETLDTKQNIREQLQTLGVELNQYLAKNYNVTTDNTNAYQKWSRSHKPFHWLVEFGDIIEKGGFDVIIGNPPYKEYSEVKKDYKVIGYKTENCGNMYAMTIERSFDLSNGPIGMIVQLPLVCTDRMKPVQSYFKTFNRTSWFSNFDDRPGKLFKDLQHCRVSIFLSHKDIRSNKVTLYATKYNRWYSKVRSVLFDGISYEKITDICIDGSFPKLSISISRSLIEKLKNVKKSRLSLETGTFPCHYHNSPQYWIRAMDFIPYFWSERDGEKRSPTIKSFYFDSELDAAVTIATLNSSLFYWWFIVFSSCRTLTLREIRNFPISVNQMEDDLKYCLSEFSADLMQDLKHHSNRKEINKREVGRVVYDEFFPGCSKHIIDKIDRVLAKHYGFTDEELDFIINYDIKYRMGLGN